MVAPRSTPLQYLAKEGAEAPGGEACISGRDGHQGLTHELGACIHEAAVLLATSRFDSWHTGDSSGAQDGTYSLNHTPGLLVK